MFIDKAGFEWLEKSRSHVHFKHTQVYIEKMNV